VPATFLAVTKPYAERRTIATARRRWPHKSAPAGAGRIQLVVATLVVN
jgi:hypothetical protein